MSFVERHRKITLCRRDRPTGQDVKFDAVNDFDLLLVRNIDANPTSRLREPKRLGMSIDHHVTGLVAIRVQKPKASGSLGSFPQLLCPGISDDHPLPAGVVTNVVGIVRELCGCENLKGRPVIDFYHAVGSADAKETINGGFVEHSLRLRQCCNKTEAVSSLRC